MAVIPLGVSLVLLNPFLMTVLLYVAGVSATHQYSYKRLDAWVGAVIGWIFIGVSATLTTYAPLPIPPTFNQILASVLLVAGAVNPLTHCVFMHIERGNDSDPDASDEGITPPRTTHPDHDRNTNK